MRLKRSSDVDGFLSRAGEFLAAREAEHNLIFGICSTLSKGFGYGEDPPYFAYVEDQGGIVAAVVRTSPYGPVLSLADDLSALDLIARDLHEAYERLPGVLGPTDEAKDFVVRWQDLAGQTGRLLRQERTYRCSQVTPSTQVPGHMRAADESDRELLTRWMGAFNAEALPENASEQRASLEQFVTRRFSDPDAGLYLWIDGEPVSVAGYSGPTPSGIRVAPVYTPPELRRRGYATALVGQLTKQLLEEGRQYCFLFTDLANPTSNSIYQKVGYKPIMDVDQYAFENQL